MTKEEKQDRTVIDRFIDEFSFLSNFHPSTLTFDGKTWPTAEHAYQAAKTIDPSFVETIRTARTPVEAKKMGRLVPLREDWEHVKYNVMFDIVRAKFASNPLLKECLLETGNATLIEGNHWNDTYFGVCRGVGQNKLGQILMKVREELRNDD